MLTRSQTIQRRDARQFAHVVAAGVTVFRGAMVALDAGVARPAAEDAALTVVGIATEEVVGDGERRVPWERGCYLVANDAADPVGATSIGEACFAVDDETVSSSSSGDARPVAGIVRDVDADGVWVEF